MKTSITIFIFLLQSLFISAFAMNEAPVSDDSSSIEKSLVVLLDGNEYIGKILSQSKDSINYITNNNENLSFNKKLTTDIHIYLFIFYIYI